MTPTHPRRVWKAVLLALLCPVLGHIYATRIGRGWRLFGLLYGGLLPVLAITVALPPTPGLVFAVVVLLLALLGFQMFIIVDAGRQARRHRDAALTRWNRWWVYLLLLLAASLWQESMTATLGHWKKWESFTIPSGSMKPTIQPGDLLIAWRGAFADHPPQAGDVVAFPFPANEKISYLKRIVGLPGDRVQFIDGGLAINGRLVERESLGGGEFVETLPNGRTFHTRHGPELMAQDNTPEITVPPGHYFMAGDNRDNSQDSRFREIGTIPQEKIRIRFGVLLWARDWHRIGLLIQ